MEAEAGPGGAALRALRVAQGPGLLRVPGGLPAALRRDAPPGGGQGAGEGAEPLRGLQLREGGDDMSV